MYLLYQAGGGNSEIVQRWKCHQAGGGNSEIEGMMFTDGNVTKRVPAEIPKLREHCAQMGMLPSGAPRKFRQC